MFQSFETQGDPAAGPARLAALREAMSEAGVQGFLIPRGDAHMGENVAPRDERLAWLTGFTGSAGLCIALAHRAAVFVDGRYALQVRDQVDAGAFELLQVENIRPADWLREAVSERQWIGYDPWLHSREALRPLQEAAEAMNAELVPVERNLVDRIWPDQPAPPAGRVSVHPEALAGESAASKRHRIAEALREKDRAAAVITSPDSLAWLLNIRGSDVARMPAPHAFGLLHDDGRASLFIAPEKLDDEVRAHLGNEVEIAGVDGFGPALDALSGYRVLLDEHAAPLWVLQQLEAAGAEIDWGRDPCVLPKATKTEAELEGARAAHRRDGAAMVRFLRWLEETAPAGGLSEIDAVQALEGFRRETGELRDIAFDTICGAGPHGAVVHYRVTRETDRAITRGELVLIDSGGQYADGTTDITRTVATGPAPEGAARAFTLVLRGMIGIARARWPRGMAGRDLDALARAALWRAGLDYDHGTGHGVGAYLGVHEGPIALSRRNTVPLEPGMILSDEPGCYREGEWGIRIENLLAVTPPEIPEGGEREMLGFETLTLCPIDRRLILPELLEAEERAWLDSYHLRVAAELSPLLTDPADRAWLEAACAPLSAAST